MSMVSFEYFIPLFTVVCILPVDAYSKHPQVQEGMTPLNHLSQGPGNDKLRDLLLRHLEEQRKRRAIEACSETKGKMDALENELSNIVGLDALKLQLRKWAKGMLLDERRRSLGLKVGARRPPHMAFLGNPGTGNQPFSSITPRLLVWLVIQNLHVPI